ncbi:unnamed protein product [Oppiella nova]|uniref:Protein MCM10 homolog n=1 Tax=Oppiella nova TaxID=334625 RepID=A0A7R9LB93_9ACAR|nr:unnamed protein product [Oppiella nova]CAG2161775.1 unnamed protein product [Oppiella nova]
MGSDHQNQQVISGLLMTYTKSHHFIVDNWDQHKSKHRLRLSETGVYVWGMGSHHQNQQIMDNKVAADEDEELFANDILALINDECDDNVSDGGVGATDGHQDVSQTLKLIDDSEDIFAAKEGTSGSCGDNETSVRQLFGDMSDDEELGRESCLTKEGQLIADNLNRDNESTSVSLFETKRSGDKNGKNIWTQKKPKNAMAKKQTDDSIRDVFSGIRLINPLISSDRMRELMSGRKMVKMSLIKSHINRKTQDIDDDWVTIGVVVNKVAPKVSKNGKQYSIWKLSDMKTKNTVSFFLFGDVYAEHWKLTVGSVVGLLNAKIMSDDFKKDSKYGKSEICSLTIDNSAKLLVLGTAKDLGYCRAVKKNQEICGALINLAEEDFCVFHVRNAYKKFASKRAEIQSSFSNVEPKKYGLNAANGGMFCNGFADGERKDGPIVETKVYKSSDLKTKRDNECKTLTKVMKNPISKAAKQLALTCGDVKANKTGNSSVISAKDVFKSIKRETNGQSLSHFSVPALAKGYKSGDLIDLSHNSSAKLRAIQTLTAKPIVAKDPNDTKKSQNKRALERIKARIDSELIASGDTSEVQEEEEEKRVKRLRTQLISEALGRKSVNERGVEEAEAISRDKYFSTLEKKEKMETKLSETYEVECVVISCHSCQYTAHSASDLCRKSRHKLVRHKATKRFFKCKNCKNRSYTFNVLIPTKPCSKCGQLSYDKTSIVNIKEETTLVDKKLQIRGEELKFLNTNPDTCLVITSAISAHTCEEEVVKWLGNNGRPAVTVETIQRQ